MIFIQIIIGIVTGLIVLWLGWRFGSQKIIFIMLTMDISGQTKNWGKSIEKGVRKYFNDKENKIKINGKTYVFEICIEDDGGISSKSSEIAKNLLSYKNKGITKRGFNFVKSLLIINSDKFPTAIIGPISSSCAKESIVEYKKVYKIRPAIHFLPVPTGMSINMDGASLVPYIFRMVPDNSKQIENLLNTLDSANWINKCNFIFLNSVPNRDYINDMEREFRNQMQNFVNGNNVERYITKIKNKSYFDRSPFKKLVNGKNSAVVVFGSWSPESLNGPSVSLLLQKWKEMSHQSKTGQVPYFILSDFSLPDAEIGCREHAKNLDNVSAVFQVIPNNGGTSRNKKTSYFIQNSLEAYGNDAALLIHSAIEQCQSVDVKKLAEEIRNRDPIEGLAQLYEFREDNENHSAVYHLYKFNQPGERGLNHVKKYCVCKEEGDSVSN